MKQYQVWVDPLNRPAETAQEVWQQLGETDSMEEAYEWYLTAKRQENKYSRVRITENVVIVAVKQ